MHDNLKVAWKIMMAATLCGEQTDEQWEHALLAIASHFSKDQLDAADANLGWLRQPDDLDNVRSPMWLACVPLWRSPAGEASLDVETNAVLAWLWENAI